MAGFVLVSIIICTANRAEQLRQTLRAIAGGQVPPDLPAELLVVDNASTDDTANVARSCQPPGLTVRYVHEPQRGLAIARNTGIAHARGDLLLFTDDDVRPPPHWLAAMCAPMVAGDADAVAGGVKLAPHLNRPWLSDRHRQWLSSTDRLDPVRPPEMVGANMAFARRVLAKVPGFDAELGAGALGFAEDSLFSLQAREAGFRLVGAMDVAVEHHFEESRLLRQSFLDCARKRGQTSAYVDYHWHHQPVAAPRRAYVRELVKLIQRRIRWHRDCHVIEGCADWEMRGVRDVNYFRQLWRERQRPRRYEKHGLVKLDNE